MAKNRDEAIVQVNTRLVPTLKLVDHRPLFNTDLIPSLVFRKDVKGTQTPVSGSVVIDFSNKDLAIVTTTTNLFVTFTNLVDGEVKHIHVTKSATNIISFGGANYVAPQPDYINKSLTTVIYSVTLKNSIVIVDAINVPKKLVAENRALIEGADFTKSINNGSITSFSMSKVDRTVVLSIEISKGTRPIGDDDNIGKAIIQVVAGYSPIIDVYTSASVYDNAGEVLPLKMNTAGEIILQSFMTGDRQYKATFTFNSPNP